MLSLDVLLYDCYGPAPGAEKKRIKIKDKQYRHNLHFKLGHLYGIDFSEVALFICDGSEQLSMDTEKTFKEMGLQDGTLIGVKFWPIYHWDFIVFSRETLPTTMPWFKMILIPQALKLLDHMKKEGVFDFYPHLEAERISFLEKYDSSTEKHEQTMEDVVQELSPETSDTNLSEMMAVITLGDEPVSGSQAEHECVENICNEETS